MGTITNQFWRLQMISVGIDVSKEKSTVCILKPYGEIVSRPFEVCHVEKELSELSSMLLRLNDDVRVVMEATGIYHLPVLSHLKEKGLFVAVVNPFEMKEYRCQGLRRVKTDKQDAVTISNYRMPGIKTLLKGWNETNGKDKLGDFAEEYWHYDNITKKTEKQFIESYLTPIPHRPKCWYGRQCGCYEKSITL